MKKIVFLVVLSLVSVFFSCSGEAQETAKLRKAVFNEYETVYMKVNNIKNLNIETGMNNIAGVNGVVSYYIPKDQPNNPNFRRLEARVEKDKIVTSFFILVNVPANTAITESVIYDGIYKFVLNKKGNPSLGALAFSNLSNWAGSNELAMSIGTSYYPHLLPQFIVLN